MLRRMRASLQLLTLVVVAMLVPGCFLDRSAIGGPAADGGQPPDIDAARVDAFVPPEEDAGPSPDGGPVCVPTGPELCGGGDEDCDPDTLDGSDETAFGEPCDGGDADDCAEGTMQCFGAELRCSDTSDDNLEVCNGLDDDCDGVIDEDAGCPCQRESYGDHSYLFCDAAAWTSAACPTGYLLARIDDREEHEAIIELANSIASGHWWFGGRAAADPPPTTWRWVIGGDPMPLQGDMERFSNWGGSDPNSTTECLRVNTGSSGNAGIPGRWEDQGCGSSHRYVCESVAAP